MPLPKYIDSVDYGSLPDSGLNLASAGSPLIVAWTNALASGVPANPNNPWAFTTGSHALHMLCRPVVSTGAYLYADIYPIWLGQRASPDEDRCTDLDPDNPPRVLVFGKTPHPHPTREAWPESISADWPDFLPDPRTSAPTEENALWIPLFPEVENGDTEACDFALHTICCVSNSIEYAPVSSSSSSSSSSSEEQPDCFCISKPRSVFLAGCKEIIVVPTSPFEAQPLVSSSTSGSSEPEGELVAACIGVRLVS